MVADETLRKLYYKTVLVSLELIEFVAEARETLQVQFLDFCSLPQKDL